MQGIPRTVTLDKETTTHLLQWPIAEVDSLRLRSDEFKNLKAAPGSVVSLDIESATQVCVHVFKFLKFVIQRHLTNLARSDVYVNATVGHCC